MASTAQRTAEPTPQDTTAAPATSDTIGATTTTVEHLVHGLVAIANGPDYCLCGATWPCSRREGWDDRS